MKGTQPSVAGQHGIWEVRYFKIPFIVAHKDIFFLEHRGRRQRVCTSAMILCTIKLQLQVLNPN